MLAKQEGAVHLRLSRDLVRSLRRGDPWVFADALAELPPAKAGSFALLEDKRGRIVAAGYYDPESPLAFRACSAERRERVDDAWAEAGLDAAVALRRTVLGPDTTGHRLVNGEGDRLPGLVVDVYGDTAVIKLDGPAPEGFWDAHGVAEAVVDRVGVTRVYQRFRERGGTRGQVLVGDAPPDRVEFLEHGLRFAADVVEGQKTGFFFDQRENRAAIGSVAAGRTVLNVFGYTGGFSVYALAGGASHVVTVDLAAPAIADAEANAALNGGADRHEGVVADAFDYLEQAEKSGRTWDVVIVDPPSFAPSRKVADRAAKAYRRLIAAGARVTARGGMLAAASCSSHIGSDEFVGYCEEAIGEARRRGVVLDVRGQPADHPVPLAKLAFRYLKFVLMRVD